MKSILMLTMYGDLAASSRQRMHQYVPAFEEDKFTVDIQPLFPNNYLEDLFAKKKPFFLKVLFWYVKRLYIISRASKYDCIIIQYELFPLMPSIFERYILLFNTDLILDYDDAIFHKYDLWGNGLTKFFLSKKLQPLLSSAKAVICGNQYIYDWANMHCQNCILIPTVVDINRYGPKINTPQKSNLIIGWIGSPATWVYMEPLLPTLKNLAHQYDFQILIIGSGSAESADAEVEFRDWHEESEVADIHSMDIGIMPLFDDPWAKGKCGYKLIQYMACGIPVIASPIGVNTQIIDNYENGLFASSTGEWRVALEKIIKDTDLRSAMGDKGLLKVHESYSLQKFSPKFIGLIQSIIQN
tara:strand:+ start:2582 stop:3649 length:1068 start_codon:yes stop_codon:yes gene_type:complete